MKNIIILFLLIFATTQTIEAQYVVGQTQPFQGNTTNATMTGNGVTTPLGVDTTTTITSIAKLNNSLHFLSDVSNNLQIKTGINLNAGVTTDSLFTFNPSTRKFGYRNASGISGSSEWTLATDSLYTTNANYVRVQKTISTAVDKDIITSKNTISASVGSKSYSGFASNNTTAGAISMADVVSFNSNDVIGIANDRSIGLYVKGTNSASITNRYGIFIDSILGSGSITNSYGFYYRANSRATNKFPIYIADVSNADFASTTSYFGSNIIIGGTNVNMYLGKSSFGAYPELNYNAVFTGVNNTYTYKINDPVEQIKFSSTGFTFNTAAAAAAGSAVTFRQNMIVHTNGFVGIGRITTPVYQLDIDAKTASAGNPMRLQGLLVGATSDSIVTSLNGVLRELSIAQVNDVAYTTAMPQLEFKATSAVSATGTTSITLTTISGSPSIPTSCDFSRMQLYFKGIKQIRDIGVSTRDFKITSATSTTVVIDFYTVSGTKEIAINDYFTMDIVR